MRKTIKIMAILLLGFILALLFIPLLFEDDIEEFIKEALNKRINAKIDFEDVDLSLIRSFPRFNISIQGLEIEGIDDYKEQKLLVAEELHLRTSLASILFRKKELGIESIIIDNLILNLAITQEGNPNYLIFKSDTTKEEPSGFVFKLKTYELHNAGISFQDKMRKQNIFVRGVNHKGSGNLSAQIFDLKTVTDFDSLSYTYSGIPYLNNISGSIESTILVDSKDNSYTLSNTELILNTLKLMVEGQIKRVEENMAMQLDIKAPENYFANLFSISPFIQKDQMAGTNINGSFDFKASVNGIYSVDDNRFPNINAVINVHDGSVHYSDMPFPIQNIHLSSTIKNSNENLESLIIDISHLTADVEGSKVTGEFLFRDPINDPEFYARLESNLDLEDWAKAIPSKNIKSLSGQSYVQVETNGKQSDIINKDFLHVNMLGDITVKDFRVIDNDDQEVFIPSLVINMTNREMDLSLKDAKYGRSDLTIDGQIDYPLDLLFSEDPISGNVDISSSLIDYNEFIQSDNQENAQSNIGFESIFKRLDIGISGTANNFIIEQYDFTNVGLISRLYNDKLNIEKCEMSINESKFSVSGEIENLYASSINDSILKGNLIFISDLINIDDFLSSVESEAENSVGKMAVIPANQQIQISTEVKNIIFKNILIENPSVDLIVKPHQIDLVNFAGESMLGILSLEGFYNTAVPESPSFSFKYDMNNIAYPEALKSLPLFKSLAPIGSFIDGYFNSSLILSGNLNLNMLPDVNSLTGQGFLETLEGRIIGFPPLEKLKQLFDLQNVKEWTLRNSKNWFAIEDGYVMVQEFDLEWQGISFKIAGRHKMNRDMDYVIKAKVPREKLQKSELTALADKGLQTVQNEIQRAGIDISTGEYLDLDIFLKGSLNDPNISIRPMGMSNEESIAGIVESKIEEKAEDLQDSVKDLAEQQVDSLKEDLKEKQTEIKDSLANLAKTQLDSLIPADKIKDIFQTKKDSSQQSMGLDSIKNKVQGLFGKDSKSQVDSIQDALKKWNPFTKKNKKNL